MREELFKTDNVDDSWFMSADLIITKGVHENTLQFNMNGQRESTTFTLYKQGIVELHKFLSEYLNQQP